MCVGRVRYNKLYWSLSGIVFRKGTRAVRWRHSKPKQKLFLLFSTSLYFSFIIRIFLSFSFRVHSPVLLMVYPMLPVPWILLQHPLYICFILTISYSKFSVFVLLSECFRVNFSVRVSSIRENAVCLAAFL